jgi:hypothetical protein
MNLTQSDETLNIISQESSPYRYIHVVQDVTILETTIVNDEFTNSVSYYNFTTDGYFIITEIKLPVTPVEGGYYISGDSVFDPEGVEITVEDVMALSPENTNIIREDQEYITLYFLQDYYLGLLKAKYLKNICACGCGCIDKQDKVQLDTLTMGLDLIEALQAKFQYYEVQRIVEKLLVCFGLQMTNCNCR